MPHRIFKAVETGLAAAGAAGVAKDLGGGGAEQAAAIAASSAVVVGGDFAVERTSREMPLMQQVARTALTAMPSWGATSNGVYMTLDALDGAGRSPEPLNSLLLGAGVVAASRISDRLIRAYRGHNR